MKRRQLKFRTPTVKNKKRGVLILECIDHSDPGSEGRFLSHMFDLMEVKSQYVEVRTPNQLIGMMECCPYKFIHITTHGCVSDSAKKFLGWWTADGDVSRSKLGSLESKMSGITVISTACKSASQKFGSFIVNKLGCNYYISPKNSPKFYNSILFAHIFYHKHFVLEQNIRKSFEAYANNYKNPHKFSIFERE